MAPSARKKVQPFSAADAWNAVSPEERLELISKSHAEGISAAIAFMLLMSAVAYGFDKIWLLGLSAIGTFFVMPLFASHAWRRGKPALIMQYLAARSVSRRYAFGAKIPELDLVLIFRGQMKEIFADAEAKLKAQRETVDFNNTARESIQVWVTLMRGGMVLMSERLGGASLEFASTFGSDFEFRQAEPDEDPDGTGWMIVGTGLSRGRKILLKSQHKASLYVFGKRVQQLLAEIRDAQRKMDALRIKDLEALPLELALPGSSSEPPLPGALF